MTASELRIGNYYSITEPDGIKYKQVTYLIPSAGEWFSDGDNLTQAAKPIPLTEEWLKKFGFERYDNDPHFFIEVSRDIFPEYFNLYKADEYYYIARHDTKIRFVHQLMNLYFALTGTELTIK